MGPQEKADLFEVFLADGFDRSLRADGHEDGGFYYGVIEGEFAGAGSSVSGVDFEAHGSRNYCGQRRSGKCLTAQKSLPTESHILRPKLFAHN